MHEQNMLNMKMNQIIKAQNNFSISFWFSKWTENRRAVLVKNIAIRLLYQKGQQLLFSTETARRFSINLDRK